MFAVTVTAGRTPQRPSGDGLIHGLTTPIAELGTPGWTASPAVRIGGASVAVKTTTAPPVVERSAALAARPPKPRQRAPGGPMVRTIPIPDLTALRIDDPTGTAHGFQGAMRLVILSVAPNLVFFPAPLTDSFPLPGILSALRAAVRAQLCVAAPAIPLPSLGASLLAVPRGIAPRRKESPARHAVPAS